MRLFKRHKPENVKEDVPRFFPEIIRTPTPSVGVVIGTYGAVPYIALQLEARRRFWPTARVLVHDDCSPAAEELEALCGRHGVDFICSPRRLGDHAGDMDTYVAGLEWGLENQIEIVVKVSRRLLLHHDWVPGLQQLAYNTQYATYGNACIYYDFPLRSECVGMHVETWIGAGTVAELRRAIEGGERVAPYLEPWYHQLCWRVHQDRAPAILRRREQLFPRDPRWGGYGIWHMLGLGRHARVPGVLWHDINPPEDYWRLAQAWGLSGLTERDFALPGQKTVEMP